MIDADGTVRWRLHLPVPRARVFELVATDRGRRRFWVAASHDRGDAVELHFGNGATLESRVLAREEPGRFSLTYFDDSVVTFEMLDDGAGGTDLVLTERGLPEAGRSEQNAGWVSVLLGLKAAAVHGIDLRNHHDQRTWDRGYVDV